VKYFEKIRQFVAEILMKKQISKQGRKKSTSNFDLSKNIGVVFNSTKNENLISSKKFIDSLVDMNIEVTGLALYESKKIPDHLVQDEKCIFFNNQDFNFFYQAKTNEIKSFIKKDFDILIDLCIEDNFLINCVVELSASKFKVGKYDKKKNYDFMINIKDGDLDFYIEQIILYVSSLKV
jgi:hypothetical protein